MTEEIYDYYRDIMKKGNYKHFSSGNYALRNERLVDMLKGFNFKIVVELAGAEGDLAEKILDKFDCIVWYYWSDYVREGVKNVKRRIKDKRLRARCLDMNVIDFITCDLFVCTSIEHTYKYREIIEKLKIDTLVLLSLTSFDDIGHKVFFKDFTDVIRIYGDILEFIKVDVFIPDVPLKEMFFEIIKRLLNKIGILGLFRSVGLFRRKIRVEKYLKWLVIAKRVRQYDVCKLS